MNEPETNKIEGTVQQETDHRAEELLQDLLDGKDIKLPVGMIVEYIPKSCRWVSDYAPSCKHCKNGRHDGEKLTCGNLQGIRQDHVYMAFRCIDYEKGEFRGQEVYELYQQGRSSKEIANILGIPEERLVRCFGGNEFACGIITSLLEDEVIDIEPKTDENKRDEVLEAIKEVFGERWFTVKEACRSMVGHGKMRLVDYWFKADKTEWVEEGLLQEKDGKYRLIA